jgi:hypothetical protein
MAAMDQGASDSAAIRPQLCADSSGVTAESEIAIPIDPDDADAQNNLRAGINGDRKVRNGLALTF